MGWIGAVVLHEDGDSGIIIAGTTANGDWTIRFCSGYVGTFSPSSLIDVDTFAWVPTARDPEVDGYSLDRKLALLASITSRLRAGDFVGADTEYAQQCEVWWAAANYSGFRGHFESEFLAAERDRVRTHILKMLDSGEIDQADTIYREQCATWWDREAYDAERHRAIVCLDIVAKYSKYSLRQLNELLAASLVIEPTENAAILKLRKLGVRLARYGLRLDMEQRLACARPEERLLISARAGSGKTRTLAAIAALAIDDEQFDPDQLLVLAFNAKAAKEIGDRIREITGVLHYRNARTFHSLAWQLADHAERKLVFDDGNLQPSKRQQSRFVERVIHNTLTPEFKEKLYEFFRREIEQVERIGSNLAAGEYFSFRRAMEDFSLGGDNVRSNGEKFIADYLFEHGIGYVYEKVYSWKSKDKLNDAPYRPDFCLTVGDRQLILEHWGIDPEDPNAELPKWWKTKTSEYREQIRAKRAFWADRGIQLIETHSGMLQGGREAFEKTLQDTLVSLGICCEKLDRETLVSRVARAPRTISRLSELFLAFISRAKKRGWSPEQTERSIAEHPDPEPRNRVFHELAARAYFEYESLLKSELSIDFDDLLISAVDQVRSGGANVEIRLDRTGSVKLSDLRWILIDEFQDFSELYYRLIDAILVVNPNIRVVAVGDDWQAINGFAGAQLTFFERFGIYFKNAGNAAISTNYRSARGIVGVGNRIMAGRGQSAVAQHAYSGEIAIRPVDKVWVGDEDADKPYFDVLPSKDDRRTAQHYQAAKALKACIEFIVGSVFEKGGKRWLPSKVLILSRTSHAYGLTLTEFESCLNQLLIKHPIRQGVANDAEIDVMTAHRSKGREADTVVILEVTARQFPKVHADNQLFGPFGVTVADTLAEERRLFYVAVTRAEHRLLLLTETKQESPYLEELGNISSLDQSAMLTTGGSEITVTGALAQAIQKRLDQIDPVELIRYNVTPCAVPLLDRLVKQGYGTPTVPHFMGDLCAEIAWPNAKPPVVILTGHQKAKSEEWKGLGWRVHLA